MKPYEKDLADAMKKFQQDKEIHELQGMPAQFFFSDIRLTAEDEGKNLAQVAKHFINEGYRLHLAFSGNMLAYNWNGELSSIKEKIENHSQYLIRVNQE